MDLRRTESVDATRWQGKARVSADHWAAERIVIPTEIRSQFLGVL